jgi:hypothetical protein
MHPMSKSARVLYYEVVFELQEVLYRKCHLGSQTCKGGNLSDLDMLSINIFLNDLVHLLLTRQELAKGIQ